MSKVDGRAASPLTVRSLSPLGILNAALRAVPALKYALGVAGLAVLGAVVVAALGKNIRVAAIVLGGMLVAMVLLFVLKESPRLWPASAVTVVSPSESINNRQLTYLDQKPDTQRVPKIESNKISDKDRRAMARNGVRFPAPGPSAPSGPDLVRSERAKMQTANAR